MTVFFDGRRRLHYLERGRGEPVVMLHGLGSSGADWALQVQALEARCRLIVPDLPGSGHSAALAEGHSVEGFAAAIWSLVDHLGIERPSLVGFSMGGAVALQMALQRPHSVPRLALINSLASYRLDHWTKWFEARVPVALIGLLGMRRAAPLLAARLFPHPGQRWLRDRAVAQITSIPSDVYLGMGRGLQRWSVRDRLMRLPGRSLVLAAEHDYTPLAEKRELAARLGAEFVLVRGSRHGTPFDAVEATNAALSALLADQPLPRSVQWVCDDPQPRDEAPIAGTIAEEHAMARLH
jgi:pimeloyl-ACP methyl ester carboxylesterase